MEGAEPWVTRAVDSVRQASTPADRAYRVADLGSQAVHDCEPLKRAFASVATMPFEGRWAFLKEAIPEAMLQCDCNGVDIAGMDSYLVLTWEPAGASPSEKLAEIASQGRSIYWWMDGHCQRWTLSTEGQLRLRRDQPGMVPLDIDIKIDSGTIVLTGPRLAKAKVSTSVARRTRGPRIVGCRDRLQVESIGSHWIEFAGGGAWALDEAACRGKNAPPSCITAVAATTRGSIARTDLLQGVIRKRGSVFWLTNEGCQAWRFDSRRRRLQHDGVYYEYDYGGSSIRLSGPNASTGSMGIGSFGYYDVWHTDADFALVDGFPWYLDGSACTKAERIMSPSGDGR